MSPDQVIRAWKDADYGACLAVEAASSLPAHPIGPIDVADSALDVSGGSIAISTEYVETLGCCQGFTQAGTCDVTVGGGGFVCTMLCFSLWMTAKPVCR
jgi:mersacidin/lichenicidin family type 2 lantibiotic